MRRTRDTAKNAVARVSSLEPFSEPNLSSRRKGASAQVASSKARDPRERRVTKVFRGTRRLKLHADEVTWLDAVLRTHLICLFFFLLLVPVIVHFAFSAFLQIPPSNEKQTASRCRCRVIFLNFAYLSTLRFSTFQLSKRGALIYAAVVCMYVCVFSLPHMLPNVQVRFWYHRFLGGHFTHVSNNSYHARSTNFLNICCPEAQITSQIFGKPRLDE